MYFLHIFLSYAIIEEIGIGQKYFYRYTMIVCIRKNIYIMLLNTCLSNYVATLDYVKSKWNVPVYFTVR